MGVRAFFSQTADVILELSRSIPATGDCGGRGLSVAHELAHFLLEDHELGGEIGFLCSREDMLVWGGQTRHQRQETEANRFVRIELLAPPHLMNCYLSNAPDLRSTLQAGKGLDISLEAATRRYVELHEEPLAAVMTKANVVRYALRSRQFPRIKLTKGDRIAPLTATHSAIASGRCGVGEWAEANATAWLDRAHCELFEQTRLGEDGYAITLLWATRRGDTKPGLVYGSTD